MRIITDYKSFGMDAGLTGETLARYTKYMTTRWPEGVTPEYAGEWADRFVSNTEFVRSDIYGRTILSDIDGDDSRKEVRT